MRPAMMWFSVSVCRHKSELEEEEMIMLRFSLGATRMDRNRNDQIRGTVKVEQFGDEAREERWWTNTGQRMSEMELPGDKRRF